jgi:hypothetical protein
MLNMLAKRNANQNIDNYAHKFSIALLDPRGCLCHGMESES